MAAASGEEEEVPPEFECSICMKLLLDPVSVTCGHTFCRSCLEQSLGYRGACAVCRAPVAGVQAVNVLIRGIIADRFPRALAQRHRELQEELSAGEREADEARRREATGPAGAGSTAPVLPLIRSLQTVLPHCRLEVELSYESEVRLVEHALQGSRRIGAVDGPSGFDDGARPFGVCLEIGHVERMPGQQMIRAHLVGIFRFWVVEPPQMHEDGFELGRCEAFFDEPLPLSALILSPASVPGSIGGQDVATPAGAEEAAATGDGGEMPPEPAPTVARHALDLVEQQLVHVGQGGRHAFAAAHGDVPQLRSSTGATTSAALEQLSFWLLGALVSDDGEKRRWLASVDTRARLEASRRRLELAGSRPILDLPGARSWMNPGQSGLSSIALLIAIVALFLAKAFGLFEKRQRGHGYYDSPMEDTWIFAQMLR